MKESDWWRDLRGRDINTNAFGFPPYNVRAVATFIAENIEPSGTVLDIGCGPGRLGHELSRRYPHVSFFGIDVAETMVELSWEGAPRNWTAETTNGEYVPSREYSAAYSVTVFQHLPHDTVRSYIEQVHTHLIPGGHFLTTYAVGDEDTFLSHQTSHEQIVGWLVDSGFTTVRLDTPSSHPNWNWVLGIK